MCNFTINNEFKNDVLQLQLETDEEMFDSSEGSDIMDVGPLELKEIYYRNMTINHYNEHSDMIGELVNERIHIYGKFRIQEHSTNRYCASCLELSFKTYEYHAVYDNILELHNDIESCILGKKLNIFYGRYFCTFCDSFLFHVEFADEMNCETCKLEVDEEDAKDTYDRTHISYLLQTTDE